MLARWSRLHWLALAGAALSALLLALATRRLRSQPDIPLSEPVQSIEPSPLLPSAAPPPVARPHWLAVVGLFVASFLLLAVLPRETGRMVFVALVAGSFAYAGIGYRRAIYRQLLALAAEIRLSLRQVRATEDTLEAVSTRQAIAEIGVVAVVALAATSAFLDTDPYLKLPGGEAEWLTSSAYFAASSLREYGYIPLWQPYLESGEPLIDDPFSFVLNPISAGPALLFGGAAGIRISVVLYALLAGIGGWALGRVLGFAILGRVLLGLLMVGKGNMVAMIGAGYFQLGVAQAYFPWIVAATLAVLRQRGRRWPVILLAVSFALLFTAGNIWYTLPMLVTVVLLGATHILWRNWRALLRLLFAGALTLGLSAVPLLPIWANRTLHTGAHPDEQGAGWVVDPAQIIAQYYSTNTPVYLQTGTMGGGQFYHSFVAPLWFFIAAFAGLPLLWFVLLKPNLHPPPLAHPWRIWGVAVLLLVVATIWGAGGNPIMIWLYDHVPLLRQWRFVGRALAWGSFWLAVLLAARMDSLWRATLQSCWRDWTALIPSTVWRGAAALALAGLSGIAAYQTNAQWKIWAGTSELFDFDDACLDWLRRREPDRPLTVYRLGYDVVYTFLDHGVRLHDIEADYQALPQRWTLGHVSLLNRLPEYGMAWVTDSRHFLLASGYRMVPDSARVLGRPCLYHKPDALSYAFTVPKNVLHTTYREFPAGLTTPVADLERLPDRIRLWVNGDTSALQVLALQEAAFPGWRVSIDGQPARLEVVGGLIGVILPVDNARHEITFEYRPPLLYQGGAITLITGAFCILYLLRGERWLRRLRRNA
jgi:hypothetical protein